MRQKPPSRTFIWEKKRSEKGCKTNEIDDLCYVIFSTSGCRNQFDKKLAKQYVRTWTFGSFRKKRRHFEMNGAFLVRINAAHLEVAIDDHEPVLVDFLSLRSRFGPVCDDFARRTIEWNRFLLESQRRTFRRLWFRSFLR